MVKSFNLKKIFLFFFCLILHANLAQTNIDLQSGLSASGEEYWENRIYTETILNIIKNYYVDTEKTKNRKLILETLEGLSQISSIKFTKKEGAYEIKIADQDIVLGIPNFYTDEKIVNHLVMLEKLIEIYPQILMEKNPKEKLSSKYIVMDALLHNLDAHSSLLNHEAFAELRQGTEGKFGGLGVLVGVRDELLTVIKPLPNSPAERIGILKQDKILSINGKKTYGYSLNDLVDYMKGAPGSTVNLELLRDGLAAPKKVQLQREIINVQSVESEVIKINSGGVLKLNVEGFSAHTAQEIKNAVISFQKKQKLLGIIMDLRGNPGGLLDQSVQVADLFLSSGLIVSTKGRHQEQERAKNDIDDIHAPLFILIDGDSASASEIVAGALLDHNRAIIIGDLSFGKGSVQTVFELPQDEAIKISIARYYTPLGHSIQNVGIVPNIWLQPVFDLAQNENLLGSYRYKSERFLSNHLNASEQNGDNNFQYDYQNKIYYETSAETTNDIPLEVAKVILNSIYTKNTYPLKEEMDAKALLKCAQEEIESVNQKYSKNVETYLKEKFHVSWNSLHIQQNLKDVEFFSSIKDQNVISQGELEVPFTIKNMSNIDLTRASVFVSSIAQDFPTFEKLVGVVPKGETLTSSLKFLIPSQIEGKEVKLFIALAVDGIPTKIEASEFTVSFPKKELANVKAALALHDGEKLINKLGGGRKAKILVTVTNDSSVAARDMKVRLINLSGNQISLSKDDKSIAMLNPQQSSNVEFEVSCDNKIHDKNLDIGILIRSSDFAKPYKALESIEGVITQ